MRILTCDCTVVYTGRGDTILPRGKRVIIFKENKSVIIHSDGSGIVPLNYMSSAGQKIIITECPDSIRVDSPRESLHIQLHEVIEDHTVDLGHEEGLIRDGTEAHIQDWLMGHLEELIPELKPTAKEYRLPSGGAVDIACKIGDRVILCEVKRTAPRSAGRQLWDYCDVTGYSGILIGIDIRPGARNYCKQKGLAWIELKGNPSDGYTIHDSYLPYIEFQFKGVSPQSIGD